MEKAKLQAVAAELNDVLGLDPVINVDAAEAEIEDKIKEAVLLIEKGDKVSSDSVTALVELGFTEHLTACGLIKKVKAEGGAQKGMDAWGFREGSASHKAAEMIVGGASKEDAVKTIMEEFQKDERVATGRYKIILSALKKRGFVAQPSK